MSNLIQEKVLLSNLGIEAFNEMQTKSFQTIQDQNEVVLLAPTGSGKTLAFLWPIISQLNPEIKQVQCLILTPTRELALQIEQVWKKLGTGYKVNVCYGGHAMQTEIQNLTTPPALLIGTPGRIEDHLVRDSFRTQDIKLLILDEFDKSLQLGFHEQMATIIQRLSHLKKKVLVSATPCPDVPDFVKLKHPVTLDYIVNDQHNNKLQLHWVRSTDSNRNKIVVQLLSTFKDETALIFCNQRETAESLCNYILSHNIAATFYHGKLEQEDRELALIRFRNGSVHFLISTDLASRGLDIPEMKHVIHYDLPGKLDEFTHRNGRTARMYESGSVYVLASHVDHLPKYIDPNIPEFVLPTATSIPLAPQFTTVYISGGKKDKINKVDIVGFFLQKGKLAKEDLGLIDIKDHYSFAAIKNNKVNSLLKNVYEEKMKGKKYRIQIAK